MSLIYDLYQITTYTSLHAGTGRSEFTAIDHQVQRDHRGFPTIFKSSMKGALSEHFTSIATAKNMKQSAFGGNHSLANQLINLLDKMDTVEIDKKTEKALKDKLNEEVSGQTTAGVFNFMDANLFSVPIRSNVAPFFNVTCTSILKHFVKRLTLFTQGDNYTQLKKELTELLKLTEGCVEPTVLLVEGVSPTVPIYLEEFSYQAKRGILPDTKFPILSTWLDNNLVIVPYQIFNHLTDNFHLPIIPRNNIENGISTNLWYEQVVPPETRFFTFIGYPENNTHYSTFISGIDQQIVNIGASISVGYGRCLFEKTAHQLVETSAATTTS